MKLFLFLTIRKTSDNPKIELSHVKFRDKCPSVNWFLNLEDEIDKIE